MSRSTTMSFSLIKNKKTKVNIHVRLVIFLACIHPLLVRSGFRVTTLLNSIIISNGTYIVLHVGRGNMADKKADSGLFTVA